MTEGCGDVLLVIIQTYECGGELGECGCVDRWVVAPA